MNHEPEMLRVHSRSGTKKQKVSLKKLDELYVKGLKEAWNPEIKD